MYEFEERQRQVCTAKLAEQADRYADVVEAVKKIARMDVELTVEERNLLQVGYKNVVGVMRDSWQILSSIEQKEEAKGNAQNVRRVKGYIKLVEDELNKVCHEILSIIAIHLLPSSTAGESIAFFYKMKGDYYRYLAEFRTGSERKEVADQSLKAYQREREMYEFEERQRQVCTAKLAEQAERYADVVEAAKKIARMDVELTVEERNLLQVGYKNVVGVRRDSWQILSSIEQKEEAKGNAQNVRRVKGYIKLVEDELNKVCHEILSIIAIHLLPSSIAGESIAFFYKMKGDYYRYLAEFRTGSERKEVADQSLKAYQAAISTAMTDLPPTDPIRLGLALNLSILYYEILDSPERACNLVKQALDDAVSELDSLGEDLVKESTLIMQLLKDNLMLWTSDLPEESREQSKPTEANMDTK
ncbi:hypothetical protein HPP92_010916 [Vanilla planifolia]|uniref:14-3-3 domain-containing protein n=1 Tax=Vanilla planifolia TaxID=51239 RepID=A0A835RBD6_VANPL|nr:hypothetical protein HPP92_010916 [Vanilla planifolia]